MTNKSHRDLPSMTPDRDQVEAFKTARTPQRGAASKGSKNHNDNRPAPGKSSSGGVSFLIFLMLLISGAVGFGGWYFYEKDIKTQAMLNTADQRIAELENQLSVTGEEMGESTGAMKVRLEKLTAQTSDLWEQMDKLWASAWRRNQADIAKLVKKDKTLVANISRQSKANATTSNSLKAINQQISETEFSLGVLTEQLEAVSSLSKLVKELGADLETLKSRSLGGDQKQIGLASNVNDLNSTLQAMIKRIQQLETQSQASSAQP